MSTRPFIHDDFLLPTPTARRLYHGVAAPLPIIDYHNHLDAAALALDRQFVDLAELWIKADPYKHRAMRIAGVPEADITGPATARTTFDRWASTVPKTLGNPLYHWTALELKRYFDIDEPLTPASADRIWSIANEKLRSPEFSARRLLSRMNVQAVVTSDPPGADLAHHAALADSDIAVRVLPSLRIDGLGDAAGDEDQLLAQVDAFDRAGCRMADHSLDVVAYDPAGERARRFRRLCGEYARRGWTLQLHMGAQRRTSTRLRTLAGPAGGYATAGSPTDIAALCALLDDLERADALPRTILYPLNIADFTPLAILTGSFAEDGVTGKVQLGPAWWYNDHDLGIRTHLDALSRHGLLSVFIGMTTDSRSLMSMTRHEYFRRVLCDWIGKQVDAGAWPGDEAQLAALISAVCHDNAAAMLKMCSRDN